MRAEIRSRGVAEGAVAHRHPRHDYPSCHPYGAAMADLQKLLFETKARVSDREILATARLNARVKEFAGREVTDDIVDQVGAAIAEEADRLIAEGVLRKRPDWLAVVVRRRLWVALGANAVHQLSRELREAGEI
jgi:hypothetical protein